MDAPAPSPQEHRSGVSPVTPRSVPPPRPAVGSESTSAATRSKHVHASLALRAAAWLRRPGLDRALAAGTNDSLLLQLRAEQLLRLDTRAWIADWIELTMTESADQARRPGAVPLQRVAIALAHVELVRVVTALRTSANPSPQSVAMALHFVTDHASPLYTSSTATALRDSARQVAMALLDDKGGTRPPTAVSARETKRSRPDIAVGRRNAR